MSITRNEAANKLSLYLSNHEELRLSTLSEEAKLTITPTVAETYSISYSDDEMLAYLYIAITQESTWDTNITSVITLYHGTPQKDFVPNPNYVNEETDYGSGLYLTTHLDLAKEWSAAFHNNDYGYVHSFELDISDLQVFDFNQVHPIVWLAVLAEHYKNSSVLTDMQREYVSQLINKYNVYNANLKDVLYGWRADSSFSNIFVFALQNKLSVAQINTALHISDLNNQYCIKSEKAYSKLRSSSDVLEVNASTWRQRYFDRISSFDRELESILYNGGKGPSIIDMLED